MVLIQQMSIGGRSVSFFTAGFQAIFCGLGFAILFNLHSIFHKLSFQSISSIQCPMFFIAFCIKAQVFIGSLISSLLIFGVLVIGGITQAICGRHNIQIYYGSSCISFSKAQFLHSTSAWCAMFIYGHIRFSIIILISFIKEGIRGIVSGHTSRQFHTLSCKPKQASHFFFKIMSQFPKSVIKRGILYCLCLLTRRQICKILVIGCPVCPLYLQIKLAQAVFPKVQSKNQPVLQYIWY